MRNIFQNTRIKFNELLEDAKSYLSLYYNQNDKVFTPASPFGQILLVLVGLTEKVMYYIEDSITETNILTASRENSIKGLIALSGYQPKSASSASGIVKISYNGLDLYDNTATQLILPNYSRVFCKFNNLYYLTLSDSEIRFSTKSSGSSVSVKLIQGELFESSFTGTGRPLSSFRLNERFTEYVDDNSIKVKVNGVEATRYESIYDMPLGTMGYISRIGVSGGIDIFFGNSQNGRIPPIGSLISVSYIKCSGSVGNIIDASNVKFEFADTGFDNYGNEIELSDYLTIYPENGLYFGSEPESLETSRIAGPKHSRSHVLSNTDAYISYLSRMNYFTTIEVFNTFNDNNYLDDNVVYMFLIPNLTLRINPGTTLATTRYNYFTAPLSSFLLNENEETQLISKIEESGQVMIGTEFELIQPTVKRFTCNVVVDYFKGFSTELIKQNIVDSLSKYFINYTRRDKIPKSDLITIIENISGIDSVNVYFVEDPNNKVPGNETYINDMGDIVIGKRDYPLIRGGWTDSNNISYAESLSDYQPSSLNITLYREVDKNYNSTRNKSVVSTLRNNF